MVSNSRLLLILCLTLSLSGCFTIKAERNPEDRACNLVTRELSLKLNGIGAPNTPGTATPQAGAALILMPIVSFAATGPVVLVGNIAHWVEKQGKCTDAQTERFTKNHTEKMLDKGGKVVEKKNFADWLHQRTARLQQEEKERQLANMETPAANDAVGQQ